MGHLIQDEANLCIDTERVDLNSLCASGTIDEDNLCTDIGDTVSIFYRADTTVLTADLTSIRADYQH